MKKASDFVVDTRWTVISQIISTGLAVPLFIILAIYLGKREYGLFVLALAILKFIRLIGGSGLGHSTGKYLANLSVEDRGKAGPLLGFGLLTQMVLAVLVAIVVWVSSRWIGDFFNAKLLGVTLKVGAITLIFFILVEFTKACLQGLRRFDYLALLMSVEMTGKIIFAAGLALFGFGLITVWTGFTVALSLASLTALILLVKLGLDWPSGLNGAGRQLIGYSLPLVLTAAGFIIYTELDNLMLGYYTSVSQVGVYAFAMNIARSVPVLAGPIGLAAAPTIVGLKNTDPEKSREFVSRLFKYLFTFFFPVCVAVFVLAPRITALFPQYAGAGTILRVMSVSALFMSFSAVLAPMLNYLGEAPQRAKMLSISVGANVLLNFLLIPLWGGLGAALATAFTYGPYSVNNATVLARVVGLRGRNLARPILTIGLAGLITGGVIALAVVLVDSLVAAVVLAPLAYITLLVMFGSFSRDEISQIVNSVMTGLKLSPVNKGEQDEGKIASYSK